MCRNRDFTIPESDAYIAEELASPREGLSKARQEGSAASRTLRTLEQTIEAAEASEHTPRRDSKMNPTLERALDNAGDLAARAENQPAELAPRLRPGPIEAPVEGRLRCV